jgi:RNA polymerase sigma factor (TIGR02999 family)
MSQVTQILQAIDRGDKQAAHELLPLIYQELRHLAAQKLAAEQAGQTLQPTALVHEAYLRLLGPANANGFANQRHFFAAAAEAMRRILVEHARAKGRLKRNAGGNRVEEVQSIPDTVCNVDDILDLDEALKALGQEDPDKAALIELRYFAGLSEEEAAACLGISRATAARNWAYARAWLFDRLSHKKTSEA